MFNAIVKGLFPLFSLFTQMIKQKMKKLVRLEETTILFPMNDNCFYIIENLNKRIGYVWYYNEEGGQYIKW
jgi:hypothetical protein